MRRAEFAGVGGVGGWVHHQVSISPSTTMVGGSMMGGGRRLAVSEMRAPPMMARGMEDPRLQRFDRRDRRRGIDRLVERMQALNVYRNVEPTMRPTPGSSTAVPNDPPPAYTPRTPA